MESRPGKVANGAAPSRIPSAPQEAGGLRRLHPASNAPPNRQHRNATTRWKCQRTPWPPSRPSAGVSGRGRPPADPRHRRLPQANRTRRNPFQGRGPRPMTDPQGSHPPRPPGYDGIPGPAERRTGDLAALPRDTDGVMLGDRRPRPSTPHRSDGPWIPHGPGDRPPAPPAMHGSMGKGSGRGSCGPSHIGAPPGDRAGSVGAPRAVPSMGGCRVGGA